MKVKSAGILASLICLSLFSLSGQSVPSPQETSAGSLPQSSAPPEADSTVRSSPGRSGARFITAEGLENWQLEYDLSGYKPGKYNILVRAIDAAGNESFAGPFNIIVDPLSDLPVTQISHPLANMRVGGDLIIVGTAVDDDAVKEVQIRLNDGDWQPAEGTDYWSFLLKTADVPDGSHLVSARALDKFGTIGAQSSVRFNLDRTKPLHSIGRPDFGALVSGRFTIQGTVYDANELKAMEYSMDSGKTWRSLRLSLDKQKTGAEFSLPVDTRSMPDGPAVVWFRTQDNVGSVGTSVFLYFVDNTKPEISFISPAADTAINGAFTVTGRVFDVLGVSRLEWEYGKEKGEIELLPGNPYFSQQFPAPEGRGRVSVVFRATDITGNVSSATLTRAIDPQADQPRLQLATPQEGGKYQDRLLVSGQARDVDGIAKIVWRLGNNPEQELATDGSFAFELSGLKSGAQTLFVRAVDSKGISSPLVQRSFTWAAEAPELQLRRVVDVSGTRDFKPGLSINTLDGKAAISGSVIAANPLSRLVYQINNGPEQVLPPGRGSGSFDFTIPLPSSLPFGVLTISLTALDSFGRTGRLTVPVYALNFARPRVGPLLDFADAGRDSNGLVTISPDSPLLGAFITPFGGEDIQRIFTEPALDLVRVSNAGSLLRVEWQADGISPPVRVVVETIRGHRFESDPMIFRTDTTAPQLRLEEPVFGSWHRQPFAISGAVLEPSGLATVEYAIGNGSWQSASVSDGRFSASLASLPADGPVLISVRASDASGNTALLRSAVMVDTNAPRPERLAPIADNAGSGNQLFLVRPGEAAWSIDSIELDRNGATSQLEWSEVLSFAANPAEGPVVLRLRDKAGNFTEFGVAEGLPLSRQLAAGPSLESLKQNAAGAGVAASEIEISGSDAVGAVRWVSPIVGDSEDSLFPEALNERPIRVSGTLNLNISIKGITLDPRKAEALWGFSATGANQPLALRTQSGSGVYTATLRLPPQADGRQDIWLTFADTQRGQQFTRIRLEYDTTPAALRLLSPGEAAPGTFLLAVQASDTHGISAAEYEINKEVKPFDLLPGDSSFAVPLSFPARATQMAVIVRVSDGSGNRTSATYTVRYDRAADSPQVSYLSPVNDAVYAGGDSIIAYAVDNQALASISLAAGDKTVGAEGRGPLFALALPDLIAGKQNLALVGLDRGGVSSERVSSSIIWQAGRPTVVFQSLQQDKAPPVDIRNGDLVQIQRATVVNARLVVPNGIASAEYRINQDNWTKLALAARPTPDGSHLVQIPLAPTLPYERFVLQLRIVDARQQEHIQSISLYRVSPTAATEAVDGEGLYLSDVRLDDAGRLLLAPGDQLTLLFNGRPIRSARLEPELPFVSLETQDSLVVLKATSEGLDGQTRVLVTTVDGQEFSSQQLRLTSDATAPRLDILSPAPALWVQDSLALRAEVSDANGVEAAEYSLDAGESWLPLTLIAAAEGRAGTAMLIDQTLALTHADGASVLSLRVTDKSGRVQFGSVPYFKDTVPPAAVVVAPRAGDLVNGSTSLVLEVSDAGDVIGFEYSLDGESWLDIPESQIRRRGSLDLLPSGRDAVMPPYLGYKTFSLLVDFSAMPADLAVLAFRLSDKAGNVFVYRPLAEGSEVFLVDVEGDKPVVEIQIPEDNEVMQADFVVSGMVFDDDGVQDVFWRLDEGEWQRIAGSSSFSVAFKLHDLSDNEHLFEAYAVDLYGVQGAVSGKPFRVSREEPAGQLDTPDVSVTNRHIIVMEGIAADANGIAEVWLSFDNGNTWNRAEGTESWRYVLDTRILQDGVHSIYLRFIDGYGIEGFSAGLISVDNTAPLVELDTPQDGSELIGSFMLGGRVSDGVVVESLLLEITPIGSITPPIIQNLPLTTVFSRQVDISQLEPGWYNIKVTAADRASNQGFVSRNIRVLPDQKAESIEFIFPAHGELLSGTFSVDGRIVSSRIPDKALVLFNNEILATVEVSKSGFFTLPLSVADLVAKRDAAGEASFRLEVGRSDGSKLVSEDRSVVLRADGPWLTIDKLVTGDFIIGRPFVSGAVGWDTPPADRSDKVAWAEYQKQLAGRKVVKVEFSRDNGRTFEEARGTKQYRFRLETQEYPNGELRLLVRATFANGETVVRKRIVTLDTQPPEVRIVRPAENGRFNQSIIIEGTGWDLNGLEDVAVVVRSGDKSSYEVPGFIQGAYLDAHLLGATRFEAGVGLSFFDDNVKLQVHWGQGFDVQPSWENLFGIPTAASTAADRSRFGGNVLGAKLLANVAYIPFSYFFGPDLDFFSMSFAVGASFTYFSQQTALADIFSPPGGKYMVLSGVIAQWEFAKFTFDLPMFRSYGFYVEGGLIFIPSEASTRLEEFIRPNVAFGLRIGIF